MHAGLYKDVNDKAVNFIVGMKESLNEIGYMNSTDINNGSWNSSARRAWCNFVFYNALPSTLKPIFKQFKTVRAATYNGSTNTTSNDYFTLPAEKEVFDSASYSRASEVNALTQFDYYKTASNRIKKVNGASYFYWESSLRSNNSAGFCCVSSSGTASVNGASGTGGLAPFGCI